MKLFKMFLAIAGFGLFSITPVGAQETPAPPFEPPTQLLYASAELGPTGQPGGLSMQSGQRQGARFQLTHTRTLGAIGGHVSIYNSGQSNIRLTVYEVIPEPATVSLLGLGSLGLLMGRRRGGLHEREVERGWAVLKPTSLEVSRASRT